MTVISGTFKLGMGEVADPNATEALPTGSFFALPTGHPHFVYADEETVVQISTNGPWGLTYVNPADDPRKTHEQITSCPLWLLPWRGDLNGGTPKGHVAIA